MKKLTDKILELIMSFQELVDQTPNDQDLGRKVRQLLRKFNK